MSQPTEPKQPPLIVGIGGTLRSPSSSERALVESLRAAEAAGARTLLITGQGLAKTAVTFESSINAHNLRQIEERLTSLQSPRWPTEILGKLDDKAAERWK